MSNPATCPCRNCKIARKDADNIGPFGWRRMQLCWQCGNKRCPHCTDHRNECTRSNATDQHEDYPEVSFSVLQNATEQPPPIANAGEPMWDRVIAKMRARDRVGRERYGTPLQACNGRDALQDAQDEALDLCVYLEQAIVERDEMAARIASLEAENERFRLAIRNLNKVSK